MTQRVPCCFALSPEICSGAADGGVENKVLLSHGINLLEPLHAASLGALGGAVLGIGLIVGWVV